MNQSSNVTAPDGTAPEYDYSLYYHHWHNESDEYAARMAACHRADLQPLIAVERSEAAIDIGCGMGFAILALQQMGFTDVVGVDVDAQQVKACQAKGLKVEQVTDTIAYLEQFSNHFGLVLLMDVLEHIPVGRQIAIVKAIHKAMKPGGQFIIQAPNASSIIASRWRYNDFTHYSSFTEHSLRFVLLNAGFSQVEMTRLSSAALKRPSLRLWQRAAWQSVFQFLRRWLVRAVWRQVLIAELGEFDPNTSIDLNLHAIAFKQSVSP